MSLAYLPVPVQGPPRADPLCFVLFTARPDTQPPDRFLEMLPTAGGGVFMAADPVRAGDLLRIAAARSDLSGALAAAIGSGWLPYRVPYSAVQVTSLAAALHPGDAWAAVVYTKPTPRYSRITRKGVSTNRMDANYPPPPVVYYGVAPVTAPYDRMPVDEAGDRAEVFFRVIITRSLL